MKLSRLSAAVIVALIVVAVAALAVAVEPAYQRGAGPAQAVQNAAATAGVIEVTPVWAQTRTEDMPAPRLRVRWAGGGADCLGALSGGSFLALRCPVPLHAQRIKVTDAFGVIHVVARVEPFTSGPGGVLLYVAPVAAPSAP